MPESENEFELVPIDPPQTEDEIGEMYLRSGTPGDDVEGYYYDGDKKSWIARLRIKRNRNPLSHDTASENPSSPSSDNK